MSTRTFLLPFIVLFFTACDDHKLPYDAAGTFEAVETIVSAEATGTLDKFTVEEGQYLEKGQIIGYIDTTQLYLKKKQLQAQVRAVLIKKPHIATEIASLQEELAHAKHEQLRLSNLVKADAATPRELDNANTQVAVIRKRIAAQQSSLSIVASSLQEETAPLYVQIEQIDDQLLKSKIINAEEGTVLGKYAEENEVMSPGKPLYKIADLSTMVLRAYLTGDQLPNVKIGQEVTVQIDQGSEEYKDYAGIIEWISSKAEFTPKTIQTKKERANLVYAMKIRVKNDGFLKIGMYGQVLFEGSR